MECRVLGPMELRGDSASVGVGGPQQRRVLAALLADPGRVLSYDRLLQVLWPGGDEPPNARRSAITYVSRLRAALGEGVVETTDAGYVLDPRSMSVDADRFTALLEQARAVPPARAVEILDEALALWRGPVFGDLHDEWWARPYATRLEEFRLTAMADRVDALAAPGWDGRAVAEALALVDAHPLREQFVDRAMRGQHAIGQTADALRTYQDYRTRLADETGLDPSAALVDLERSIVAGSEPAHPANVLARPLRGYVLRELIGEGSFGSVYRATQPGVDRDVAVKVIRAELADDRSFVQRFEAEAQLVARLEHPHIVPLYDFWREPGGAFLVFRLLRGGSAADVLACTGPYELDVATKVLEDIGSALAAAHEARVVHRDVKPANILFDSAGQAYLTDFGIAASTAEADAAQRWSAGSILYASPEQLRDGTEDAAADQYALAATMWELLAGHPAFAAGDSSAVVGQKLRGALPALEDTRPGLPPGLGVVLTRAGAVHPADRYADVADFVTAWRRAVAGDTAATTDSGHGQPTAGRHGATVTTAQVLVANPYKGLRPFAEGDAVDFHGRGALTESLAALVAKAACTLVVGPSGSGKSSLVRAGLVPRLRQTGCLVVTMTPGDDPFAALAVALDQVARADQADLVSADALQRLDGVERALRAVASEGELVVVVDQLEELWTLAPEGTREPFVTALVGALRPGVARAVATVRADFFDRPLADPVLGPVAAANTFAVTPMSVAELHEAITAPAEAVGVRVEPALVSQLVADASEQPGSLPLLQFALAELFERRSGAVMTTDAYVELGGLGASLARQADDILSGFDAGDQAATRRMFLRLVSPGEGNEDTRRRVVRRDLAGVPDHVVAPFVERRLLTTDRDLTTREPTVEVAHEVLLRGWPRLRSWLDEDRAWLRELRNLSVAAAVWDHDGRDDADLLRGARLSVVDELAAAHEGALTEVEDDYLVRSRHQADAEQAAERARLAHQVRQNRRLRRALAGVGALLVVALAAGTVAVVQQRRADRQQRVAVEQRDEASRQRDLAASERANAVVAADEARAAETSAKLATLAGRSLAVRSSRRDVAALLAVEAWQRQPDAASKSALFGTFTFDPGFLGYLSFPGSDSVEMLAIPGTQHLLAIANPDEPGRREEPPQVVDALTGALVVQLEPLRDGDLRYRSLTASSNGEHALVIGQVAGADGAVVAPYDVATGTRAGPVIDIAEGRWPAGAISDDGERVALASAPSGDVRVYDTATATLLATLPRLADAPLSVPYGDAAAVAFGPDGLLYVGSQGTRLRAFDARSLAQVDEWTVPRYATAGQLAFVGDGTVVARGMFLGEGEVQNGAIARVDLTNRSVAWDLSGSGFGAATSDAYGYGECASFTVSAALGKMWCGNYFGLIRERSLATGARTGTELENQKGITGRLDVVTTSQGPMLVAGSSNEGVISRWGLGGLGPAERPVAAGLQVRGYLSDGTTLLVGRPTGARFPFDLSFSLWDSTTDREIRPLDELLYAHASGRFLAGIFTDGRIGRLDATTGRTAKLPPIDLSALAGTSALSPDEALLALGYLDGRIEVYDVEAATLVETIRPARPADEHSLAGPSIGQLAFSPDGHLLMAGNGLWSFDPATGRQLAYDSSSSTLGVSAGLADVVASEVNGDITLRDPDTLARIGSLPGGRGFAQQVYHSADGATIVAAANDGTVSVIDAASRTRLGDPIQVEGWGGGAPTALRADGGQVAISSPTATVLWDLDPDRWVTAACALAGRNLTREEWSTYLGDLGEYHPTCPAFPEPPAEG